MVDDFDYIAFIDEAGDPGLKKVKPFDKNGSSEWLMISAVVMRSSRVDETKLWANELMNLCCGPQAKKFHFHQLKDAKQIMACDYLASKPVRAFVACSNKKNMKNWRNPFAETMNVVLAGKKPNQRWFYYWLSRIVLEKLTDYIFARSMAELGRPGKLKLVFSQRGGIYYDELEEYYRILYHHDHNGTQHLNQGAINWAVLSKDRIIARPHNSVPGLITADIVASSFFAASDRHDRNREPNPLPAMALNSIMTRKHNKSNRSPAGYGVKLMPSLKVAKLDAAQHEVYKYYGYKGW